MALADVNIDDRSFDQLLAVLRRQIPGEWSDHNPSDLGVMLLELLLLAREMMLYRMNRVPAAHEERFLDLLVDPPEPVTVPVTFDANAAALPAEGVAVPPGTRVATAFSNGRRFVFETLQVGRLRTDAPRATVLARELLEVRDELLGTSDGGPSRYYELAPLRSALGLEPEHVAPVLVDDVHRSAAYEPNPRVRAFGGYFTGIGGRVSPATGFRELVLVGAAQDQHFFVEYASATRELTMTSGSGATQTVVLGAGPIAAGEVQSVEFGALDARLVLDDAFEKTIDIGLGTNSGAVAPAPAAIGPVIAVVATVGSLEGVRSTSLAIDATDPARLIVSLDQLFSGSFDASTLGTKRVVLADGRGNSLSVELDVTGAFVGGESAVIVLGALENLVVFGGEEWSARHSLLTQDSRVTASNPARHFRVDPWRRRIQFGDGTFGAAPRAGLQLACSYRVLIGPAALIEEGEIRHLLSDIPGLSAGDVTVTNTDDAYGGGAFFDAQQRLSEGLAGFRRPHRLVSAGDFERALLEDFNRFQELAKRAGRIARVVAVMNRVPPLSNADEQPGSVTLLVVRRLEGAALAAWEDPATTTAQKEGLLAFALGDAFARRILAFLEARRLLTTRLFVTGPALIGVGVQLQFVSEANANAAEVEQAVGTRLRAFLDLVTGGLEGRGWPPGRRVYRSDLYRVVESVRGVDHVLALALSPAGPDGDVVVAAHQAPLLEDLEVRAVRP